MDELSDGSSSPEAEPALPSSQYDYCFVAGRKDRKRLPEGMEKRDLKKLSRSPHKPSPLKPDGPAAHAGKSPAKRMVRGFVLKDEEPEEGQDPTYYDIERILRRREREGTVEYLIKWEGFEMHDCTWEPAASVPVAQITKWENEMRLSAGDRFSQGKMPQADWSDDETPASQVNSRLASGLGIRAKGDRGQAMLTASQSSIRKAQSQVKRAVSESESDLEPLNESQNALRYSSMMMYRSPLVQDGDAQQAKQQREKKLRAMSMSMELDAQTGQLKPASDASAKRVRPQSSKKTKVVPVPLPTVTPAPSKKQRQEPFSQPPATVPLTVAAERSDRVRKAPAAAKQSPLKQRPSPSKQLKQPPRSPFQPAASASSSRSPFRNDIGLAPPRPAFVPSPVRNSLNRASSSQPRPSAKPSTSPFRDPAARSPFRQQRLKSPFSNPSPINRGLTFGGGASASGAGHGSAAKKKYGSASKRKVADMLDSDSNDALFTRVNSCSKRKKTNTLGGLSAGQSQGDDGVMTEHQKEVQEEQLLNRTLF